MRILIVSDSHGTTSGIDRAVTAFMPDMIIHLGDIERDVEYIEAVYPDVQLEAVVGNNDWWCERESEKVIEADGIRIFITHGHRYGVYDKGERIAERAAELGCELAFFGHSHIASDEVFDGVRVINPGSVSRPRAGNASVGVLETEGDGKFGYVLCDWI